MTINCLLQNRRDVISEVVRKKDEGAAIFLAGQAVIACREGLAIECMSVEVDGETRGWIDVVESDLPKTLNSGIEQTKSVSALIRSLLAGLAAEERHFFGSISPELNWADEDKLSQDCLWRSLDLAQAVARPEDRHSTVSIVWRKLAGFFNQLDNWNIVKILAECLMRDRELTAFEINEILHQTQTSKR